MYLYIAVIVLVGIVIYKNYITYNSNKTLSGTIAVVGNGPISEEDRKNINKFEKVNIYTHEPAIRIISW